MKFKLLIESKQPIYLIRGSRFKRIDPRNKTRLEIGTFFCPLQDSSGLPLDPMLYSLRFNNQYGIQEVYKLSKSANIYETLDMISATVLCARLGLLDFKSKNLNTLTYGKFNTLRSLIKYYFADTSKYAKYYKDSRTPTFSELDEFSKSFYRSFIRIINSLYKYDSFYSLQGPLKDFLEAEGYDGIHYTEEDDDVQDQYLIWNTTKIQLIRFDNNNLIAIDKYEQKLRQAIDHSFEPGSGYSGELLKGDNYLAELLEFRDDNGNPFSYKDLEDIIIRDLKLKPSYFSDMPTRLLDAYINLLINDGLLKGIIAANNPDIKAVLPQIFNLEYHN